MKYTVTIADKSYEVEVEDIHARPIIAYVGGTRFEVQPEIENQSEAVQEIQEMQPISRPQILTSPSQVGNPCELTSPLPGTIVEVFVRPGDEVEVGKIVLVIEAMKMKNSIRCTCAGKVAEVFVSKGQTVMHKQTLVRFE